MHAGVPFSVRHWLPQKPQASVDVSRSVSQRSARSSSHSPSPAGQGDISQAPATHICKGVSQVAWQEPQWLGSLSTWVSQPLSRMPSQSAHPSSHVGAQVLASQPASADPLPPSGPSPSPSTSCATGSNPRRPHANTAPVRQTTICDRHRVVGDRSRCTALLMPEVTLSTSLDEGRKRQGVGLVGDVCRPRLPWVSMYLAWASGDQVYGRAGRESCPLLTTAGCAAKSCDFPVRPANADRHWSRPLAHQLSNSMKSLVSPRRMNVGTYS